MLFFKIFFVLLSNIRKQIFYMIVYIKAIYFSLSKFLWRSLMIFIIRIFGLLSSSLLLFHNVSADMNSGFFRCVSNSETYRELWTTSFIEYTGVTCSDFVSHNWVRVFRIPVLLLACSQDWTCNHSIYFRFK